MFSSEDTKFQTGILSFFKVFLIDHFLILMFLYLNISLFEHIKHEHFLYRTFLA